MAVIKGSAAVLLSLVGFFYFAGALSAQDADALQGGAIPEVLLRPQRGEAPRYPRDVVIGELGRGDVPEGAYLYARRLLSALLTESRGSPPLSSLGDDFLDEIFAGLKEIDPRVYHFGGGREEPDGSISFLFRFIGRERGISGELYLRSEEGRWELDDLILEDPQDLLPGTDNYRYDFSPYERIY